MSDPITLSRDGAIAEVTLTRPEKHNALSLDMLSRLAEIGRELQGDPTLRAVIIAGAGANFCSGIDTALFMANPDPKRIVEQILSPPEGEAANIFQKPVTVWQEVEVPVIAAITGACYGAGLQLALGADLRIAAPDARLAIMEINWGLIPDMGLTTLLPRLMRADRAKELILTGRIVDAAEAEALGLVTRCAEDPLADARACAETIAEKSPDAVRRTKRLVAETWQAPRAAALRLEAELQAELIGQPNQIEAVLARVQKRAPHFT